MGYLTNFLLLLLSVFLFVVFLPARAFFWLKGAGKRMFGKFTLGSGKVLRINQEDHSVHLNLDAFDESEQETIRDEIARKMDEIPRYEGEVRHAYELGVAKNPDICPKCQSPTRQCYANFIYATREEVARAMFAPAGFFCTKCPTVVIDNEMIEKGVTKGFRFQRVVGVDYGKRKNPDLFLTMNGKKAVYVFDENQNLVGLETVSGSSGRRSKKAKAKRKGKTTAGK